MICKRTCNECDFFWNISVSYSYSYNRLVETLGLLCGSSDNLVIVFQHSNVHQPSGNNIPTAKCISKCMLYPKFHAYCIHTLHTKYSHAEGLFKTTNFDSHPPYLLFYSSNKIRKAQIENLSIVCKKLKGL